MTMKMNSEASSNITPAIYNWRFDVMKYWSFKKTKKLGFVEKITRVMMEEVKNDSLRAWRTQKVKTGFLF